MIFTSAIWRILSATPGSTPLVNKCAPVNKATPNKVPNKFPIQTKAKFLINADSFTSFLKYALPINVLPVNKSAPVNNI